MTGIRDIQPSDDLTGPRRASRFFMHFENYSIKRFQPSEGCLQQRHERLRRFHPAVDVLFQIGWCQHRRFACQEVIVSDINEYCPNVGRAIDRTRSISGTNDMLPY